MAGGWGVNKKYLGGVLFHSSGQEGERWGVLRSSAEGVEDGGILRSFFGRNMRKKLYPFLSFDLRPILRSRKSKDVNNYSIFGSEDRILKMEVDSSIFGPEYRRWGCSSIFGSEE